MEGIKRLEQEVMEMNNFNVYAIFNQIKDLPELQDKFDNKEKTIKGMYEYVYEKARTVKQGNVAMVNDRIVCLWAANYFKHSNEELGIKEKKLKMKLSKTKKSRKKKKKKMLKFLSFRRWHNGIY